MNAIISRGDKTAHVQLPVGRKQLSGVLSYLGANHTSDYDLRYNEENKDGLKVSLECFGVVENAIAKALPVGFRLYTLNEALTLMGNLPYQNRREVENSTVLKWASCGGSMPLVLEQSTTSLSSNAQSFLRQHDKTTLLRLISRLEKPTRGVIMQNIDDNFGQKSKQSKKWYHKIGVVYQNPDYQLFMPTVEKEIKFGAKSDEYADEIAEKFGIKHLYARHPQSLSEGQKRRVSIAAVVATDPEVLILDEPTVGQDYRGLCKMVEVLNRIHTDTKNTMITVTHDCRCAAALCDRAVWIENGTVRHAGGKEQISAFFRLDAQCKG